MLAKLNERQRDIVRSLSVNGATVRETARRLDMKEGTGPCVASPRTCNPRRPLSQGAQVKTRDLINVLVADRAAACASPGHAVMLAAGIGAVITTLLLLLSIGMRPDIAAWH